MNLIIKSPSDLALWFEQEPAPYWGERQTMLDDQRQDEKTIHASRLPMDYLFEQPNPEPEEVENFDLNDFLMYH